MLICCDGCFQDEQGKHLCFLHDDAKPLGIYSPYDGSVRSTPAWLAASIPLTHPTSACMSARIYCMHAGEDILHACRRGYIVIPVAVFYFSPPSAYRPISATVSTQMHNPCDGSGSLIVGESTLGGRCRQGAPPFMTTSPPLSFVPSCSILAFLSCLAALRLPNTS